jgi:hypothetical protein
LANTHQSSISIGARLYADDAAIFVKPSHSDMMALKALLNIFGEASGLRTNIQKSKVLATTLTWTKSWRGSLQP